ncbi:acyl-CoA synthetase [Streptomyces sodiiphilus]|uniref:Acyl-CoA synthetase n=1 Tax=Streptomyces sodiiphilus TaxID=226217 RepID=A0ABN2NXT8_9ACTN
MALSAPTVLPPADREALAGHPTLGGGNLLQVAMAGSPDPHTPFIHSHRPLANTDGELQHDFSLAQFDRLAQSWSAWYLSRGVRPGDRVAVWLEDSIAYSLHFYSLAQIGAIAVLINSHASREIATSLIEQTGPAGLYTDRERQAVITVDGGPAGSFWTVTAEELPAPPAASLADADRFRHDPETPVALLHSSGTTGRPKPTVHTHSTIVAGPRFRLVDHKEMPGAMMMTALPQSHLGCIAYTAYALLGGTPIVALRDRSGSELAAAVQRYRPTAVMSFAHGYAELAALDLPDGALDSVDVWISIGDAVHQSHITSVLSRRSPHLPPASFFDRLGTTELGWGVLLRVHTLETERKDRCAGKPVGVAEVAVLREDGSAADDGEVGYLAARGPAVTPGYWNDSATTYRYRRFGHWLTGDMAFRDAAGDHYLVDRAADTVQTAGGVGYSVLMEEVILNEVADVVDAAVIAGRRGAQTLPVAVVTVGESRTEPRKLLTRANEVLRAAGHPPLGMLEVCRREEDFPVGVTGKVLKRNLRETYGDLDGRVLERGTADVATAF